MEDHERTTPSAPGRKTSHAVAALAILAAGMGLRVAILLTYERDVDGDEAVVGLMALRIADEGDSYWTWPGRRYNGGAAMNAHLAALSFKCFGASAITFKAPAMLWTFGALLLGYLFARDFMGSATAAWALLFMAVGPATFCRWGVKPYLGTNATLINLAIAYGLLKSLLSSRRETAMGWPLLTGALCGLGLYNSPFVLPMLAMCAVFAVWTWPGCFRRRGFWIGLVAFGLAAAPTLMALATGEAAELTPRCGLASLGRAVARAAVKAPHFFGAPYRYFGAHPLRAWAVISAVCCLLGLVAFVALDGKRVWSAVLSARRDRPQDGPALARAFVLLFVAAHFAAFVLSAQDVQYLLPAYPFLAMAVGAAVASATSRASAIGWRRAGWTVGAVLVIANVWGCVDLSAAEERMGFDKYVYGSVEFRELAALLKANDVRHVYASYANANILAFESKRGIVTASYDDVFPDDRQAVDRADRYAFVFWSGSDFSDLLSRRLRHGRVGHEEAVIRNWTVRHSLETKVGIQDIDWRQDRTDFLGCFPNRLDLIEAALRLEPWRQDYWCRWLELRDRPTSRGPAN